METWSKGLCTALRVITWVHTVLVGSLKTLVVLSTFAGTVKSHKVSFQSDDPNVCGPQRTPQGYDSAVADLQVEDSQHIKGIKANSVFNALTSFHVCKPGLPPCLDHDIFEDVLSYDVALYLKVFY